MTLLARVLGLARMSSWLSLDVGRVSAILAGGLLLALRLGAAQTEDARRGASPARTAADNEV